VTIMMSANMSALKLATGTREPPAVKTPKYM
jgi:hypothetical protein